MKQMVAVWLCGLALIAAPVAGLAQMAKAGASPKAAYYFDPAVLDLANLIPSPPADPSVDLAELHRIEASRTPEQVVAAKADENEESMFAFKTLFGAWFNAQTLPVTAALGAHMQLDESAAGGPLKALFARPRPYQLDKTLHPVCELTDQPNSYPSGHSLTGYLEGLTLAELFPQKRTEILARADDYAHNRLVCGVHYPSDTEASRRVAYVVFGYILATPRFQRDVAAAREEIKQHQSAAAR